MIFFFLPIIIILLFYYIGNIFSIKLNIDNFEKPIYGTGLIVILANYSYFNLNLTLQFFLILLCLLFFVGMLVSFFNFKDNINEILSIFKNIFILQILFSLLATFYGEQFYVFRGNAHDHFAYLTSGLMFSSYSFQELLTMNNVEYIANIKNDIYLANSLHIIQSRPSAQLMLGLLMNLEFLDPMKIGFIFKSVASILILLSSLAFFKNFKINERLNLFFSYAFLLSFFNFYNYEIDAYSLILSLPFLFLILKHSSNLVENTVKFKNLFYFKYIFIWACYFIIYPNGAAIVIIPIFIYICLSIFRHKIDLIKIFKLFLFLLLFFILILQTFDTTIIYLFKSEIPSGLKHKMDFWGYFGAFVLGKDNPIHNYDAILQIKELWRSSAPISEILSTIYRINIQSENYFFIFNIIPSIFGMFHFSTSSIYGSINYLLVIFLIIINFIFIKTIFYNFKILFKSKMEFYILYKVFIIYFTAFFIYLMLNTQFWPAIKLYFVLSPLFFILISFKFNANSYPVGIKYIMILLMLLPLYKYTEFNHGIGRLDSFPSIIKKENKLLINWKIDREALYKCKDINYGFLDKFKKNYISLIYSKKTNGTMINKTVKCRIEIKNNNFEIK